MVQLTPQPVQLSLFPSEAEQIAYIEQAESISQMPFAFSFAQEDIDHVLRLGGNNDNSRMRVAAEYMKQKPLDEIAAFLSREYVGGAGLKTESGEMTAWFTESGIRLAKGRAAQYGSSAQVIAWTDAAARIGELLEQGQFATNVELAETQGYTRSQLAESLWYIRHTRGKGASSCASDLSHILANRSSTAVSAFSMADLRFKRLSFVQSDAARHIPIP